VKARGCVDLRARRLDPEELTGRGVEDGPQKHARHHRRQLQREKVACALSLDEPDRWTTTGKLSKAAAARARLGDVRLEQVALLPTAPLDSPYARVAAMGSDHQTSAVLERFGQADSRAEEAFALPIPGLDLEKSSRPLGEDHEKAVWVRSLFHRRASPADPLAAGAS